jgi:proteasome assembly chaperone (PAC2) family protein
VCDLETLEAIAGLGFLADYVEYRVDEFGTFSVVTLGPIVTGTSLAEDEVVGAEELTERSSTDGVHGTGLKVHEDGTGDVAATGSFVKVDVDAF